MQIHYVDSKHNRRIFFWLATVVLALGAGWKVYAAAEEPSKRPYTILRADKVYDKAGVLKVTLPSVEALRSDGARMTRTTSPTYVGREIFFADGSLVRTNDLKGLKSTYPNPLPVMYPAFRDPQDSCVNSMDKRAGAVLRGRDTIDGHPAARIERGQSQRTLTLWFSLDLSCAQLQERLEHETGITESKLEAVILGEPDAALFQIADSLKEVPPSVFYNSCQDGQLCAPTAGDARRDKNYYAARGQ